MVKGRIWGTVCGKYREMEIEECDVIVVIGLKDKDDRIGSQLISFGGGLTTEETEDLVSSIADGAVRAVQEIGESPKEKKVLVCKLANEINRKMLKIILREVEN